MSEEYCVFWSMMDDSFYYAPADHAEDTLDDIVFRGTLEECEKWWWEH
jgi:hypothetical protein